MFREARHSHFFAIFSGLSESRGDVCSLSVSHQANSLSSAALWTSQQMESRAAGLRALSVAWVLVTFLRKVGAVFITASLTVREAEASYV